MPEETESDIHTTSHGAIIPIESKDIRRMVAGQVIFDLASSVKELVDNAIDSGAKSITIRLFNQGIDVIEVSDDGSGVPVESRPLLAVKHATSKITSFEELSLDSYKNGQMQAKTLGFRGEALFSLANISHKLIVSTRTENDSIGGKMEFQKDGTLDPNSVSEVARKVGTTVAVVKLFDALPVRRADLIKRIKSQKAKLLRLLQSYAVLCVGIKFHLADVTGPVGSPKCKSEVKMSTSNNTKSLKETISQVFGSKFLSGLCSIQVDLSSMISLDNKLDEKMWCIEGLVSRAPNSADVQGNVARDIQFFSINRRPVEMPKISKVIAEAWRNFETVTGDASSKKRPACFLEIHLPSSLFDVNLSPDKREVLLSEETQFHDLLRKALTELWSNQTEGKFVRDEVHLASSSTKQQSSKSNNGKNVRDNPTATYSEKVDTENHQLDEQIGTINKKRKLPTAEPHYDDNPAASSDSIDTASNTEDFLSSFDRNKWNQTKLQFSPSKSSIQKEEIESLNNFQKTQLFSLHTEHYKRQRPTSPKVTPNASSSSNTEVSSAVSCTPESKAANIKEVTPNDDFIENSSLDDVDIEHDDKDEEYGATIHPNPCIVMECNDNENTSSQSSTDDEDDNRPGEDCLVTWPDFDTSSVLESSRYAMQQSIKRATFMSHASTRLQKEKDLENSNALDSAEKHSLYLSKEDFATMSILGQFNLGFILALDQGGHLWILDQHACDEKYNFEKLCKETKVHEQKLIAPLPLELSPSEENCILEYMQVFEKNGFRFEYDSSKPQRCRLSLIAVPHSGSGGDGKKAVQFGPQDVGALCAILGSDGACSSNGYIAGSGTGSSGAGKSGNNAVRRYAGVGNNAVMLPKAVAMFASRACRSSIMVGQALTQRKMEQLVQNLQRLDHPWTCAHGRPTVRHVKDLMELLIDDES
mmetsp:Transcript_15549/g.29324  ORF Transcript_15549/g.29324 Transcript_15549/m.29324 type:complete len:928 (+) Transcript_15549:217-3000(+)